MNWQISAAQHAAERRAAAVRRELLRGLSGLATVAATASFLGFIGTALGISASFPGLGTEKTTAMAITFGLLAHAMFPAALGIGVAVTARAGYRTASAQADAFDVEMHAAILELTNVLARVCR